MADPAQEKSDTTKAHEDAKAEDASRTTKPEGTEPAKADGAETAKPENESPTERALRVQSEQAALRDQQRQDEAKVDEPKPKEKPEDREARLAEMKASVDELREERTAMRETRDAVAARLIEIDAEETKLLLAMEGPDMTGPRANQEAIVVYIRSQTAQRQKRAMARSKALGLLAGDTKALDAKAPIDAAHARPRGRVAERPKFTPRSNSGD